MSANRSAQIFLLERTVSVNLQQVRRGGDSSQSAISSNVNFGAILGCQPATSGRVNSLQRESWSEELSKTFVIS